jgi:hypothetical protein
MDVAFSRSLRGSHWIARKISRNKIAGSYGKYLFNSTQKCKLFSKLVIPFYMPVTNYEKPSYPIFSWYVRLWLQVLILAASIDAQWYFFMSFNQWWAYFHLLLCHSHLFLGIVSV